MTWSTSSPRTDCAPRPTAPLRPAAVVDPLAGHRRDERATGLHLRRGRLARATARGAVHLPRVPPRRHHLQRGQRRRDDAPAHPPATLDRSSRDSRRDGHTTPATSTSQCRSLLAAAGCRRREPVRPGQRPSLRSTGRGRQHRERADLYHSALIVRLAGARVAIEMAPVWAVREPDRGVVAEGPVGLRTWGRYRLFRYEVRCWRAGTIPDLAAAVDSPRRVSTDAARPAECSSSSRPSPSPPGAATSSAPARCGTRTR